MLLELTAVAVTSLPVGELDPLAGQSYFQIAMAGRSRHRSQDMGALQTIGPDSLVMGWIAGPKGSETALFAGVDTVLRGRERYVALVDSARARLSPWDPGAVLPYLVRALRELRPADSAQRSILEQAVAMAAGVVVDGVANDGVVTPGQSLDVDVSVWNAGTADVQLEQVEVRAPAGWRVERRDAAASPVAARTMATRRFTLVVAPDAPRTQYYFRRRPLVGGAYYDWREVPAAWRGMPFDPPPVVAHLRLLVGGAALTIEREVVHRYRDQGLGEIRRPLLVAQDFDVELSPSVLLRRLGESSSHTRFMATVTNRTRGPTTAKVIITPPSGWRAAVAESLVFLKEDEERSVGFDALPPPGARAGSYTITAAAAGPDGKRSSGAMQVIDYPHIRPRAVAAAAPDL